MVREVVRNAPGAQATPQKAWLGDEAWQLIRAGAKVRRRLHKAGKALRRTNLLWAWQLLLLSRNTTAVIENPDIREWNVLCDRKVSLVLWGLLRVVARKQAKRVQNAVKRDKLAWLEEKTRQLAQVSYDGTSSELHRQVKRCLTRVHPNLAATSRAPLKNSEGKVFTTDDEKHMLWQGHWSQLYGGRTLSEVRTFKQCTMPPCQIGAEIALQPDDLFTAEEIRAAMHKQFNGKASVDYMPTKELAILQNQMIPSGKQPSTSL
eukprot:6237438-Amphidinium_carterae.4